MNLILFIGVFVFGLIIGSFLNCIIYRLEQKKSFLKGRSYCPSCKHILSWQDLIPIFSYLSLRGRCRYCNKNISIQYPLMEISTALMFLMIFSSQLPILGFQSFVNLLYLFAIGSLSIIIFLYDLKHFIIPDSAVFSAIGIVLIFRIQELIFEPASGIQSYIFAALATGAFFLFIYLVSSGKWLGFGDVKLSLLIGLFLGWPLVIPAVFFSFCIGAIIGIIMIVLKKKNLKSEIPFGPFLIMGMYISFFWGEKIINWYLNLIF